MKCQDEMESLGDRKTELSVCRALSQVLYFRHVHITSQGVITPGLYLEKEFISGKVLWNDLVNGELRKQGVCFALIIVQQSLVE